jgi:putative flavoprotein involved in K+ transport
VPVVVIGSGPAGLAAAGELTRRGVRAVVIERGDAIGARWRSRYDGLRLNTYRGLSHLPGRRLPRAAGRYASRDAFVDHLEAYARDREIGVRLAVEAQRVDRAADGGWRVATTRGPWSARHVIVATGWDAEPTWPAWAKNSTFDGAALHISQLSDLSRFRDQRVLVVGAGTSGIDIAGLLIRAGAIVTVSMRTAPSIFPRDWLGVPLGPLALVGERGPSLLADVLGRLIQRQVFGDLSPYGMPRAPVGYMSRFRRIGIGPAVDDGFVDALKTRRTSIVTEVARLEHDAAVLVTDERVVADAVIFATGYRRGLERLVGHLGVLDERGVPRHPRGVPADPSTPGLYFAGFQVAISGSIRVSGTHARRIAKALATAAV